MGKNELAQHLNRSDLGWVERFWAGRVAMSCCMFARALPTLHYPSFPPSLSRSLGPFAGLQKRLFGVPKLEDANLAGTKEAQARESARERERERVTEWGSGSGQEPSSR